MAKDYSVFDVVGPNMIGPSSSHTAGAARLGKTASKIAGKPVKEVKFYYMVLLQKHTKVMELIKH